MSAGEALALLENSNAIEKLRENGFIVRGFRAAVELPVTESTPIFSPANYLIEPLNV